METRNGAAVGPNIRISPSFTNASYELVNSLLFSHKLRINKVLLVSPATAFFGHSIPSRSSRFVVYDKISTNHTETYRCTRASLPTEIGPGRARRTLRVALLSDKRGS